MNPFWSEELLIKDYVLEVIIPVPTFLCTCYHFPKVRTCLFPFFPCRIIYARAQQDFPFHKFCLSLELDQQPGIFHQLSCLLLMIPFPTGIFWSSYESTSYEFPRLQTRSRNKTCGHLRLGGLSVNNLEPTVGPLVLSSHDCISLTNYLGTRDLSGAYFGSREETSRDPRFAN